MFSNRARKTLSGHGKMAASDVSATTCQLSEYGGSSGTIHRHPGPRLVHYKTGRPYTYNTTDRPPTIQHNCFKPRARGGGRRRRRPGDPQSNNLNPD
jgi:hypothetical protein